MFRVSGKHNEAKIFTDQVEATALKQIEEICDQEAFKNSKIRIMPDVHAGSGCTIGTTMTIHDKIVPNMVGVDIGCGMETVMLDVKEIDFEKLDKVIRDHIPSGRNIREVEHPFVEKLRIDELIAPVNRNRARLSLGTLGGGNHFIEVNRDDEGNLYLVVHTGSRHLGLEVANYYQELAYQSLTAPSKVEQYILIEELKRSGREREISQHLKQFAAEKKANAIPKHLAYLEGKAFNSYLHDMKVVQQYATRNREAIVNTIMDKMEFKHKKINYTGGPMCWFETVHNYIDDTHMILRKGAVAAFRGQPILIPINMKDGSLICLGKENSDWNYSAPHGAGRICSRTAAKKTFSVEDFEAAMDGIYTTSVNIDTLDECPMAYKSIDNILNNIGDTVDVLRHIKPVYNFKAG